MHPCLINKKKLLNSVYFYKIKVFGYLGKHHYYHCSYLGWIFEINLFKK